MRTVGEHSIDTGGAAMNAACARHLAQQVWIDVSAEKTHAGLGAVVRSRPSLANLDCIA
jgi:hypothetical protein